MTPRHVDSDRLRAWLPVTLTVTVPPRRPWPRRPARRPRRARASVAEARIGPARGSGRWPPPRPADSESGPPPAALAPCHGDWLRATVAVTRQCRVRRGPEGGRPAARRRRPGPGVTSPGSVRRSHGWLHGLTGPGWCTVPACARAAAATVPGPILRWPARPGRPGPGNRDSWSRAVTVGGPPAGDPAESSSKPSPRQSRRGNPAESSSTPRPQTESAL